MTQMKVIKISGLQKFQQIGKDETHPSFPKHREPMYYASLTRCTLTGRLGHDAG
jgi:hypothetical protein